MNLLYIIGKYQSLYEFNVDLIGKYPAIFMGFHQQKRLTQTEGCPIISKSSQKKRSGSNRSSYLGKPCTSSAISSIRPLCSHIIHGTDISKNNRLRYIVALEHVGTCQNPDSIANHSICKKKKNSWYNPNNQHQPTMVSHGLSAMFHENWEG